MVDWIQLISRDSVILVIFQNLWQTIKLDSWDEPLVTRIKLDAQYNYPQIATLVTPILFGISIYQETMPGALVEKSWLKKEVKHSHFSITGFTKVLTPQGQNSWKYLEYTIPKYIPNTLE